MRTSPALGRGMRNSSTVSGRPGSQNTAARMKLGPPATWYPAADSADKERRRPPPRRRRRGRARREEEMDIGIGHARVSQHSGLLVEARDDDKSMN